MCMYMSLYNFDAFVTYIGEEDIIDEVLTFFRANVLFRNFDIRGGADRTLIYLTLFTHLCLVKCEKIEDKASGNTLTDGNINLFDY